MTPTTDLQKLLAEATKGPWLFNYSSFSDALEVHTPGQRVDGTIKGMVRLAQIYEGHPLSLDNVKANARLIAMAPDLAARVIELEAENKRLREETRDCWSALRDIDAIETDWTKGVDENLERVKSIARTALKGGEI